MYTVRNVDNISYSLDKERGRKGEEREGRECLSELGDTTA